jgi:hypothetical protein
MKSLRLRPGVHYAAVAGGVYFSSSRATFVIGGPEILFRVVDICVPLLEEGTDVDELVEAIGAARSRPIVRHLVDTLDTRGLVLHLDQMAVAEPSAEERSRFPEALAYLETHRDHPYADFRRIRKARVLVAGPAEALGPAVRGLLRAGVGQVQVATSEPARLARLAARHREVRLLLCPVDSVPLPVAGNLPDAAVIFAQDAFPIDLIRRLPGACVTIPVRLGKDLAIVGPAVERLGDPRGAEELWSRATAWSRLDGDELLVRPSGDLLASALAGQAALDALIGLNQGRAHLVHGPDLRSDSFSPVLSIEPAYDAPTELTSAPVDDTDQREPEVVLFQMEATATHSDATPDGPDTTERPLGVVPVQPDATATQWIEDVSGRWAGLFRIRVPGDLPQMPLALTLAEGRSDTFDGRVVGFGPDQGASTIEAGLAALRQHCSATNDGASLPDDLPQDLPDDLSASLPDDRRVDVVPDDAGHNPEPTAPAAGVDRMSWLLDGALRLLGSHTREAGPVDQCTNDDAEVRRLKRFVEVREGTPIRLTQGSVPRFEWVLVTVLDARCGSRLGSGWGPTSAVAAVAALSSAIAGLQVRRTVDPGSTPEAETPGFVDYLHRGHLDQLADAVVEWLAPSGLRLRGRRLSHDPVCGALGVWCGTVRFGG